DGLEHAVIVRAMPNTPAQIGMGVTAWTAAAAVDRDQRDRAKAILGALGEELEVDDEGQVDMATALSGTGPTYVFLLMEALVDAGVHLGFSRRVAEELVLRTVEGSAAFARQSDRHRARDRIAHRGVVGVARQWRGSGRARVLRDRCGDRLRDAEGVAHRARGLSDLRHLEALSRVAHVGDRIDGDLPLGAAHRQG